MLISKEGRTYTVRFAERVNPPDVANSLKDAFESSPEVKTFGSANQLKITTKYKIDDNGVEVDDQIQALLYDGVKSYLPEGSVLNNSKEPIMIERLESWNGPRWVQPLQMILNNPHYGPS